MIISQEQLLEITGYSNAGNAEKCLAEQGIPVMHGKGGRIWTTLDAINSALIKQPPPRQAVEID